MILKNIESIVVNDLQNLIDNSVGESKTIEYKKELNLITEKDKKEFLADISAFANTSGGDIIYGISEKSGIPYLLDGIKIENVDSFKLQIENILRDGLEPRVIGYVIKEIEKQTGIYFLIIRVPKSWNSPHRVIYKDNKKFYGRNTSGKYELDIAELRRLFALTDSISTKIGEFRENRISKIISDETPLKLSGERKVVLHIVPLISLVQPQRYNIKIINGKNELAKPLCSIGFELSYNFDGILSFNRLINGGTSAYTQFFNNGIIEAVTTKLEHKNTENQVCIPNALFERNMHEALRNYFSLFKEIRIDFPVYVFVTLINYKGTYLAFENNNIPSYQSNSADREVLLIPEVYVESSQYSFHSILRPIFDTLWNSYGYERCLSYDSEGGYYPK